jgi:hypothetical protein
MRRVRPSAAGMLAIALCAAAGAGCGPRAQLGSDLLWVSEFEDGTFSEWTSVPGGKASADPAPNAIEVSTERVHRGRYAAKLTITSSASSTQENTGLVRAGGLPVEAYYSAWYYLPRTVDVNIFWVIFKLRRRAVLDDPTSSDELYDLDLETLPTGELTLRLYDHRVGGFVPLDVGDAIVPVARWFQVEAYYRNAQDSTGHITYWLDGNPIVDISKPMAATPWVEWDACNVGENLSPAPVTLFIDDLAVSRSRVGPAGVLGD